MWDQMFGDMVDRNDLVSSIAVFVVGVAWNADAQRCCSLFLESVGRFRFAITASILISGDLLCRLTCERAGRYFRAGKNGRMAVNIFCTIKFQEGESYEIWAVNHNQEAKFLWTA